MSVDARHIRVWARIYDNDKYEGCYEGCQSTSRSHIDTRQGKYFKIIIFKHLYEPVKYQYDRESNIGKYFKIVSFKHG